VRGGADPTLVAPAGKRFRVPSRAAALRRIGILPEDELRNARRSSRRRALSNWAVSGSPETVSAHRRGDRYAPAHILAPMVGRPTAGLGKSESSGTDVPLPLWRNFPRPENEPRPPSAPGGPPAGAGRCNKSCTPRIGRGQVAEIRHPGGADFAAVAGRTSALISAVFPCPWVRGGSEAAGPATFVLREQVGSAAGAALAGWPIHAGGRSFAEAPGT
jgi:hypothetical protein